MRGLLICSDYIALTGPRSAAIGGPMTSASPIWSRDLPARLAVGAAQMCGRISAKRRGQTRKGAQGGDGPPGQGSFGQLSKIFG